MPSEWARRSLLSTLSIVLTSGCVFSTDGESETEATSGTTAESTITTMAETITIRASDRNIPADRKEWIRAIDFDQLPSGEQDILVAAMDGEYQTERPWPEAADSLVDRVSEHVDEQVANYKEEENTDQAPSYLGSGYVVRNEEYYSLYVAVMDEVISSG